MSVCWIMPEAARHKLGSLPNGVRGLLDAITAADQDLIVLPGGKARDRRVMICLRQRTF